MSDLDAKMREIEARLAAATPGPWGWIGYDYEHPRRNWDRVQAAGSLASFTAGPDAAPTVVLSAQPILIYPNTYHWIVPRCLGDLEFIEHAREDVELLLAELKEARARLSELTRG